MSKDYYKTLGVNKDASKEEIKKAYRTLAKKYHPHLNKETSSEEKMKELNEAYSVLGDDTKRSNYDRFGTAGEQFSGFQGGFSGESIFDIFEDIFEGNPFFGGRRRRRARAGSDLHDEIELTFDEAVHSTERKVKVTRADRCPECDGTGAEKGQMDSCSECNGTGTVRKQLRTPFGYFSQTSTCRTCRGTGQIPKNKCKKCGGKAHVKATKTINVKIPAGVENGSTLRVRGEGNAGEPSAPNGDLYISIFVSPHKYFQRDGMNILLDFPITISQATLGDDIEVPTIYGKVNMKIPSGTQSHTVFRLKDKGIHFRSHEGDMLVRIIVTIPKKLSAKQKQLFKDLGGTTKEKPKLGKGFLEKVKDALLD